MQQGDITFDITVGTPDFGIVDDEIHHYQKEDDNDDNIDNLIPSSEPETFHMIRQLKQ